MTDDVLRIWLDVNREAHDFIPCSYWEKSIRNMKKELSDLNIYVYEANGVVKGFVKMTQRQPYLRCLRGQTIQKRRNRQQAAHEMQGRTREAYARSISEE